MNDFPPRIRCRCRRAFVAGAAAPLAAADDTRAAFHGRRNGGIDSAFEDYAYLRLKLPSRRGTLASGADRPARARYPSPPSPRRVFVLSGPHLAGYAISVAVVAQPITRFTRSGRCQANLAGSTAIRKCGKVFEGRDERPWATHERPRDSENANRAKSIVFGAAVMSAVGYTKRLNC